MRRASWFAVGTLLFLSRVCFLSGPLLRLFIFFVPKFSHITRFATFFLVPALGPAGKRPIPPRRTSHKNSSRAHDHFLAPLRSLPTYVPLSSPPRPSPPRPAAVPTSGPEEAGEGPVPPPPISVPTDREWKDEPRCIGTLGVRTHPPTSNNPPGKPGHGPAFASRPNPADVGTSTPLWQTRASGGSPSGFALPFS